MQRGYPRTISLEPERDMKRKKKKTSDVGWANADAGSGAGCAFRILKSAKGGKR